MDSAVSLRTKRLHDVEDDLDPRSPKKHLSASLAALRIAPLSPGPNSRSHRDSLFGPSESSRSPPSRSGSPFGTSDAGLSPFLRQTVPLSSLQNANCRAQPEFTSGSSTATGNSSRLDRTKQHNAAIVGAFPDALDLGERFSDSLDVDDGDAYDSLKSEPMIEEPDGAASDCADNSGAMVLYRRPSDTNEWRHIRYALSLNPVDYLSAGHGNWKPYQTHDYDSQNLALVKYEDRASRLNLVPTPNEALPPVIHAPWPNEPDLEIYEVFDDDQMET